LRANSPNRDQAFLDDIIMTLKQDTAPPPSLETQIKQLISNEGADFIDFGCSSGGSLDYATRVFKGEKGIGIDLQAANVEKTKAAGYLALQGDLTKIRPLSRRVRFVIMSHFLEHVPSVTDAKRCIRSAINSSDEFVYIQQPFFDADPLFMQHGLKAYWSDWHGHPNRMTSLEFHNILHPFLQEGLIDRFAIYGRKPIKKSKDVALLNLSEPQNQSKWDKKIHSPKPKTSSFDFKAFYDLIVIINLNGFDAIETYKKKIKPDHLIYDSHA